MKEKDLVGMSKTTSILCSPFLMPVAGLLILFNYLSILPWAVKLHYFLIFLLFTAMLPLTLIRIYCRLKGWSMEELKERGEVLAPCIICILSFVVGCYCLIMNNMPYNIIYIDGNGIYCNLNGETFQGIFIAAIVILMLCAIIHRWYHISLHCAAIGGLLGAITSYSVIFSFNPIWWMCFIILLGGLVGTSRMVLKKYTLIQVVAGFLLGTICATMVI